MRTAIEALQAELLDARDALARKAEERAAAFRSLHAAKDEVHRAHSEEQEAAQVVDRYVNALDILGVPVAPANAPATPPENREEQER